MEQINNICQWSNCTKSYQENLYLALNSSNGLLRISEEKRECSFLGRFPLLSGEDKNLFISIVDMQRELYFIPKNHKNIILYNLDTELCDLIELPQLESFKKNFGILGYIAISFMGKIFLIERKYQMVCEVNSVTKEVSAWRGDGENDDVLSPNYCVVNQCVICPSIKNNNLYIFNMVTGELSRRKIGKTDYCFWDIYYDEKSLWIQVLNKPVVLKYSIADDSSNEIGLPFVNVSECAGKFVPKGENLLLFPERGNVFAIINKNTDSYVINKMPMQADRIIFMYIWDNKIIFRLDNECGESRLIEFDKDVFLYKDFKYDYLYDKRKFLKPSDEMKEKLNRRFPQNIFDESLQYGIEFFMQKILLEV